MRRYRAKIACKNSVRKLRARIACENGIRKLHAKIACRNSVRKDVRKKRAKITYENCMRKLRANRSCENCVQKRAKIAYENCVRLVTDIREHFLAFASGAPGAKTKKWSRLSPQKQSPNGPACEHVVKYKFDFHNNVWRILADV